MRSEDKKTLILIDGHALAFRMFFALERTNMQTTDHQPTWAIYGFFKAIFDLLSSSSKGGKNIKPNSIAVAFDVSRHTFRLEKYENYKANRQTMPDTLRSQLGLIMEGLGALNIPICTKEGFEGDDIIGTIASRAKEMGHDTYILTGDKDSFQLVDKEGQIKVLIPQKGVLNSYDWEQVKENLGVEPAQVVDYKALCGDTSDNIPGVKGIGAKTAVWLLEEYKDLDNIYKNIENITKKAIKEKLAEQKEMAYLSQFLATIKKDVDIDFDFSKTCLEIPDKQAVSDFFQKVQFYSFVKNLDKLLNPFVTSCDDNNAKEETFVKIQEDNTNIQLGLFSAAEENREEDVIKITQEDEARKFLENIKEGEVIALSAILPSMPNSLFVAHNNSCALLRKDDPLVSKVLDNENIKKVIYDIKSELNYINPKGVIEDVMLSSYIKDSSRKHDLISQIQNYLNFMPDENDGYKLTRNLLKLHEFYKNSLNEKEKKLTSEVELPLAYVLKDIEDTGVCLDIGYLKTLSVEIDKKILDFEEKIYTQAGTTFNINSPKQVSEVLFNVLKIKPGKKNKTGFSTSAKILDELAGQYQIARDILGHRQLMKLKTTYIDNLPKLTKDDGKIHTHFNQIVTTTGRLSSSDPNLQNIPVRTEFSNRIRAAFVPQDRENSVIFSADYSQIELRLLAHFSGDEVLINAFKNNEDIHLITASKIFEVSKDEVTKEMRRKAKAVNFGLIYGQTRYGLSSALGITPFEAQEFIDKYFATYPKINTYINNTLITAHQEGYVETLYGRKRYLGAELNSRNAKIREFAQRAAINAPLQGTSADLIKMAMVKLHNELKDYKSKIILQVHDELVLEVPKEELEEIKNLTVEAMELNQPLKVPLRVDTKYAKTWREGE